MVDRIEKVLRTLSQKERQEIEALLTRIKRRDIASLDVKKLKGYHDTYRVRKGTFRVIFHIASEDDVRIIAVERRSDTTYTNL